MSAVQAYLSVVSESIPLARLGELLGLASHATGWSVGEPRPGQGYRSHTRWKRELLAPADLHYGTEGIDGSLSGLDDELAKRIASAAQYGCSASLIIVQELSPDSIAEKGLVLSATSVRWLALAGASLDVDQYFDFD